MIGAAPADTRSHPAKFSLPIIAAIRSVLRDLLPAGPLAPVTVLDPFAGTGGVHVLSESGAYDTVGVELEPEWASQHQRTVVGDATALPFGGSFFDAVVTSPCYGNRMADLYDGSRDRCTTCSVGSHGSEPCSTCDGSGLRPSKRYTYRISLGRELSAGSTAGLQWGPKYRDVHERAWSETVRVLKPGGLFVLNISDHIRGDELQGVDQWHAATLGNLGLRWSRSVPVVTSRQKNGANADARAACEWLIVFHKPSLDVYVKER